MLHDVPFFFSPAESFIVALYDFADNADTSFQTSSILQRSTRFVIMADPTDLNLDAPSDLQDIPEMSMQLLPPPEGTFPDK